MSYGIDKHGQIEDNEWFGQEVRLRAMNNYGQWKDKFEAEEFVKRAMKEIYQDNHCTFKMSASEHTNYILDTVKDMMEMLNS
jgi:hypothetical protein